VDAWLRSQVEESLYASVITLAELRMGIDANPRRDRAAVQRSALDQLIRPMLKDRVLEIDEESALIWRRLLEHGRSRGRSFEPADLAIAATALAHDLTVATRDLSQFQAAGARTFNPWTDA
jgi:predicted nucleic acid-binding protein